MARHQQDRRVGDHLVDRGLVSKATLDAAERVAADSGAYIGQVLIAIGALDSESLTRALADLWGLPYVVPTRITEALDAEGADVGRVLAEQWLPLERRGDGTLVVAVVDEPTPGRRAAIAAALGEEPYLVLADRWDFQQAVLDRYGADLRDRASLGLWGRSPAQSARTVLVTWQKVALVVALVLVVLAAVADLRAVVVTLSVVVGLAFLVGTGFKFWASLRGARMEHVTRTDAAALAALPDHELPRYTVLVPVYKEANIVANLIGNLGALDYPAHLLEVLILVEEDDTETRAAAEAANPPAHFRFITVPAGAPQTKPKACNVGLEFATGEYLVIYDAEDKPEPDQLKKAVLAFRQAGEELVCVQAALNYFNADENALTRMFTLEYSFWFDYMLPGLEYGRLAIPLGGTSNHFRVSGLRRLGGWDPYNVTEDADLGIRASAEGMRVGVIDSTTYEEANTSYPNFVRQRSRWIKGYMQTTLVHLRQPFRLVQVAGLRQTLSFLFLVGGTPATFLAVPLLYAVFLASLFLDPHQLSFLFPGWVLWLSLFNLGVGSALMIYVSMMGAFKRRRYGLVLWGLANPAYWLLHSVAAYKALWQLVTKPHYWEKTAHGLTGVTAAAHVPAAVRG
ncbi:glycosyltransferase [Cellulomonas sp. ACRRI]|uniref:glycosyltransferase n=1 Tax=Cellulomonas sp. ACRRI TaxID=2918188 RepID=UPI001EF22ED9|nr:glycosyltransferase [Cellulomonas sp. ACRRI]MCG7285520.1 glycosyltransferase [Cellulomonas sp. ACRRI]